MIENLTKGLRNIMPTSIEIFSLWKAIGNMLNEDMLRNMRCTHHSLNSFISHSFNTYLQNANIW